ncbi:Spy/CpxP family protein refolding chaperone [Parabacteroides merdae]|uniref:Spy/CpxP family protein refolding chaperone n=1 Tax=Parabacteroides merdae TaxID=46503 RepID=UPI0034A2F331
MRKLIMAMLIAVSMVQTISAQDNNRQRITPQQRTEQRIQKMDEKLSLTDEQKSKIRALYADFNKQKYPKEKRKEAMEKLIADITAVLTPEQQVLYKQLQEESATERRKNKAKE